MISYKYRGNTREVSEYKVIQPPYICAWCGDKLHDRYHKDVRTGKDGLDYCSPYCANASWTSQEEE
jgi:hypothetical protein